MSRKANVCVTLRQCGGNVEKIVEQAKDRSYHKKPSVAKREKRRKAMRARLREERKRQSAQERRNRKKK